MKKLLAATIGLILLVLSTGCGASETVPQLGETPAAAPATPTQAGPPTPTRLVLATPTPQPPPPTPTPRPPTSTPAVAPEATAAPEEATQQPEAAGPPVADDMAEIPGGVFVMGSDADDPEDAPSHEADLPAFEIDRFEVTNLDFAAFADATGYVTYAEDHSVANWRDEWGIGQDNHPVVMVTWDDARAYCEWLGKRLPTEAEWETAARGDDGRRFPWGNDWDPNRANVKERGLRGTSAVGSFGDGASPFGVEDMVGNVWEWTADWYQAYPGNTTADPYYGEQFRVTRGGGWFDEEPQATAFNRNAADPGKTANDDLGFRCAR